MNKIKISGVHYQCLKEYLFPGDGLEAIAIAICGRSTLRGDHTLLVQEVVPIPYEECIKREVDMVQWPTEFIYPYLEKAAKNNLAIIKIHCHPEGTERFSELDNISDQALFTTVHAWIEDGYLHASCIMLPDGRIFGKFFMSDLSDEVVHEITVAGSDFIKWRYSDTSSFIETEAQTRNLQTFGKGTTNLLNGLKIGVVGCSGTGSPTIEMLTRLGVGTLVLVDHDHIDPVNLNRIIGSTWVDAQNQSLKTDILKRNIENIGIGTRVLTFGSNIINPDAIKELANCDFLFGCVDSAEGRYILNQIASYYLVPLIDLGVGLDADGKGGINSIDGAVHYVQPHSSSLLSREVISIARVSAEGIKRRDKEEYERNGYLAKVGESSPAVISVNMQVAATGVNEFLARLHPYRSEPNTAYEMIKIGISNVFSYQGDISEPCSIFSKWTGKGDIEPLLGIFEFTENVQNTA